MKELKTNYKIHSYGVLNEGNYVLDTKSYLYLWSFCNCRCCWVDILRKQNELLLWWLVLSDYDLSWYNFLCNVCDITLSQSLMSHEKPKIINMFIRCLLFALCVLLRFFFLFFHFCLLLFHSIHFCAK